MAPFWVDDNDRIVLVSTMPGMLSPISEIVDIFRKEFSLYCCLENDAKAMALGEARLGAGVGFKNMFTICLGRGIGGGLILNGELYGGSSSTSGEIGHITANPSGPTCSCWNRGCREVMASGPAIFQGTGRGEADKCDG